MNLGLFALAIGGFGIGTTEFIAMALLPDIATSLHISIPQVGHIISAYALGVVVGAPILTAIAGRFSPQHILFILMGLFTLFNGLSALAVSYPTLMLFRFLAGLPHGAFFGVGAVVAARLARKGKEASAVAVMFSGLTIANLLGVPFTTFIGHLWGWRIAFCLIALVGLVTMGAIYCWIPSVNLPPSKGILKDLQILKQKALWVALAITSIGFSSFFAWMSYLVPYFTQQVGFPVRSVPFLMAVAGVGMVIGNIIGGRLADSVRPIIAVIGLMFVLTILLTVSGLFMLPKLVVILFTLMIGLVTMALGPSIQMLLISHSRDAEMFGASLGQSGFNIGNALGAYLGGIPLLYGLSYASSQWVGAILSFIGALIGCGLLLQRREN